MHIACMEHTLHSTMFLLIPKDGVDWYRVEINFTFHYVSINTIVGNSKPLDNPYFTFHYVSINTQLFLLLIGLCNCLYIPLCFY